MSLVLGSKYLDLCWVILQLAIDPEQPKSEIMYFTCMYETNRTTKTNHGLINRFLLEEASNGLHAFRCHFGPNILDIMPHISENISILIL